jgi:hypothetical protein
MYYPAPSPAAWFYLDSNPPAVRAAHLRQAGDTLGGDASFWGGGGYLGRDHFAMKS